MSLKEKSVLILDDDFDFRQIVKKILKTLGMIVYEAETVKAALELADKNLPSIMITDMNMVPEQGIVFIQKSRSSQLLKSIPIIVLSGNNDYDAVMSAIELGATDYLLKPLEAPLLIRKIRKALMAEESEKYIFPISNLPKVKVQIKGRLSGIGETNIKIEVPAKIPQGSEIFINSSLLKDLEIDSVKFKISTIMTKYTTQGHYNHDVTMLGIHEKQTANIRKFVRKWK